MGDIGDYFLCDNCETKDLKVVYNFSLKFRRVNFSDDLIYDELTEKIYQCTNCQKTYTRQQIEERLTIFKERRKRR
jgi:hypothetical protein